ncbi:uncharacterized protein LOC143840731 [Paroedura picta]|uniref:uncharacterized protein LOC143840731 n=1 Tax=Paroedura picta TaxID=143630 RepID=UPI0040573257
MGRASQLYQQGLCLKLGNLRVPLPTTMLGSRVCWQLVLGWALLLGQPAFGDWEATEEPPLAESEEAVPTLQEPEEPGESENPTGRTLSDEELRMLLGPTDEELERRAKESRRWLERDRESSSYLIPNMKQVALRHHHKNSHYIYMSYENGNVEVKKAIGTMVYIKFLLVKTSCTKEEAEVIRRQLFKYDDDDDEMLQDPSPTKRKRCEVPPPAKQEIEECTFTLFKDVRSHSWRYVVTKHKCVPFGKHEELPKIMPYGEQSY